jgi:hypothetical protein
MVLRALSFEDCMDRRRSLCEVLFIEHLITPEEYDEVAPRTDDSSSESSDDR